MKHNISIVLILSLLLLSLLVVPVAGATDGDKALVKDMVQSPADHSVSLTPYDYLMHWADRYHFNAQDYLRHSWTDLRFYRIGDT